MQTSVLRRRVQIVTVLVAIVAVALAALAYLVPGSISQVWGPLGGLAVAGLALWSISLRRRS